MTRAISRDSFNELKQYIGVHLQQGRVILDSDWNEAQDIVATLARRLGQDTFGDGILDEGFEIQPVIPSPWGGRDTRDLFDVSYFQGHLPVSLRFPPNALSDSFETGWELTGTGNLRISRDRPYEGKTFLRLSDHTGQVTLTKTLSSAVDLSALQYAHFRFRLNQSVPAGSASFFIQDSSNRRNVWPITAPWLGNGRWAPAAILPLDLRFHLFDLDLLPAIKDRPYTSLIPALGISANPTWSFTGTLPTGLTLTPAASPQYGRISGTPTQLGTFPITVTATSGTPVSRTYTLNVQDAPVFGQPVDMTNTADHLISFWNQVKPRGSKPDSGIAANLSSITKYGFVINPTGAAPAIWDFDALSFSSRSLVQATAANNFVIGGPFGSQFADVILNSLQVRDATEANDAVQMVAFLPELKGTPRAYVGGLPCTQPREQLYTSQADPNDPAITTPGALRKDLVYLDVWREPVTYVEDPDLREIALGGPDTSTRMRVRQRVRVAQGGALPTDDGIGGGTLATEGTYTGRANRLYLVEVDTPGNLGAATVRWSEDNGSTIQRVIETIPASTTKVKVEDASAFQAGDFILLRTDGQDEEHRISSVVGNVITLQAAATAFALADRPKVQRWNAFHAPIVAAAGDSTVSAPINLSFGVKIRIGGRALKKGDFWTFRTRYLAGDDAAGISAAARIETVEFQPPQGVVHNYAPLAMIIRDPAALFPERAHLIRDLRPRAGRINTHRRSIPDLQLTGATAVRGNFVMLGTTKRTSTFVCVWSGTAQADAANRLVQVSIEMFDNRLTNSDVDDGRVGSPQSTTFVCESTGLVRHSVIVVARPRSSGVVAVRPTFQLLSGGSVALVGSLDIFEIKGGIEDVATTDWDL